MFEMPFLAEGYKLSTLKKPKPNYFHNVFHLA